MGATGCEGVRKASSVEREKGTAQLQSKGCEGVQRGAKIVSRRAADRRVERRASTSVESIVQVRKGTNGCEGVRKASSVEREKGTAQVQSKGCEGVQRGSKCVSRRAVDRRVERRASTSVESSVDAVET